MTSETHHSTQKPFKGQRPTARKSQPTRKNMDDLSKNIGADLTTALDRQEEQINKIGADVKTALDRQEEQIKNIDSRTADISEKQECLEKRYNFKKTMQKFGVGGMLITLLASLVAVTSDISTPSIYVATVVAIGLITLITS